MSIFPLEGPLGLSGCPGQRHGGRGRGRGPGALRHHCGGGGGREAGGEVSAVPRVFRRPAPSLGKVHSPPPPRSHTGGTPCPPLSEGGTLLLVETRRVRNIKKFMQTIAPAHGQSVPIPPGWTSRCKWYCTGGSKEKRAPPQHLHAMDSLTRTHTRTHTLSVCVRLVGNKTATSTA